jgi:hypothetical protein
MRSKAGPNISRTASIMGSLSNFSAFFRAVSAEVLASSELKLEKE